jgi:putative ABC transport system permease protein
MQTKELGFKGDQIIQIDYRNPYDYTQEGIEEKLLSRYFTIKQELSKVNGVKQVSTGSFSFGNGASSSSSFSHNQVTIQGQNMGVDFEMLNMMNITIVKGRNLSEKFATDTISSILINQTAEKMMNEKNALGKEIDWNGKKLKIVGVVSDFHLNGPHNEIPPMVFYHFKTIDWMIFNVNKIYVKVNPMEMEQAITGIEKFWLKKVDGNYPFTYDFVDKHFARTYETYVKQKNLFSLLNVIVISIAMFGLFSLASYSIQRRMKEIAIRKTLGAETKTLLKDLSKQYIVFCLIGFLLALFPVYFLLGKWLENFVYRIDITLLPFIIGFVILLILTLIVVLSKAYQATKVDVLNYLKYE